MTPGGNQTSSYVWNCPGWVQRNWYFSTMSNYKAFPRSYFIWENICLVDCRITKYTSPKKQRNSICLLEMLLCKRVHLTKSVIRLVKRHMEYWFDLSVCRAPARHTETRFFGGGGGAGGARWLSGRVSDSGARGRGFDTYRSRVVSLSKTFYSPKVLVNYPGSGGSVPTWLKNCWLGRKASTQTNKQTLFFFFFFLPKGMGLFQYSACDMYSCTWRKTEITAIVWEFLNV